MKRLFILLLCCLILTACKHPVPALDATTQDKIIPTPTLMSITVYSGNDNADGFEAHMYEVTYFNSSTLIEKLIEVGVLTSDVTLLSEQYDGTCLHLDFNESFRHLINTMGTAGEYIIMGSVENTFLDNYRDLAASIFITVNNEILESGHVIYDFELTQYE